jgi:hypothetical protein
MTEAALRGFSSVFLWATIFHIFFVYGATALLLFLLLFSITRLALYFGLDS